MSVLAALNLTTTTTDIVSFIFRINIPSFLIDDTNILNHIFFYDFCLDKPADWQHIPGIDDASYCSPIFYCYNYQEAVNYCLHGPNLNFAQVMRAFIEIKRFKKDEGLLFGYH